MKQTLKNGLSLNYTEFNENAPSTILFIHGNSLSHRSFEKQANSDLLKNFRLIFLDLPGHGDSTRLNEYSVPAIAEAVAEFVKTKKLENYILVGHSLGGHIATHALQFISPKGLFIFGTPPLKKPFDPNAFLPNANAAALAQPISKTSEIEALVSAYHLSAKDKKLAMEDYVKTDPAFRATIFNSIPTGNYQDEVELLNNYQGELHILIPTNDTFINNKYIGNAVSGKRYPVEFSFIEAAHCPQLEKADAFNSILHSLCQVVFSSVKSKLERGPVLTA